LLLRRTLPAANGTSEPRFAVTAVAGGPETALTLPGSVVAMSWVDSVTVNAATNTPRGRKLQLLDVRSNAVRNALELPDSTIRGAVPLPDGWAWIPARSDRIIVEQNGKRHEIAKPEWASNIVGLDATADGTKLLYTVWGAATEDTLRVEEVPTAGGPATVLASMFAERGYARWLSDGSALFVAWIEAESVALFRLRPGATESVGTVPRSAGSVSVSDDLKRATFGWRDYQGDAWMYRVAKP
jgi:hypothetical protein